MANVDPAYIVFSSSDVNNVGMENGDNTWTGTNTFTNSVNLTTLSLSSNATLSGNLNITGESKFGSSTNYIKITNVGSLSLEGDSTTWDDERVPVTSTKAAGVRDPGFTQFKDDGAGSTGVFTYWFDKDAEEELFFSLQMPHKWKVASTIYPHVHWIPSSTATIGTVLWGLEYTWQSLSSVFQNTTLISGHTPHNSTASIIAGMHYLTSLSTGINGTGQTISSMLVGRVFRGAANASLDTYDYDAGLLEVDFHYEIDSLGSSTEYIK